MIRQTLLSSKNSHCDSLIVVASNIQSQNQSDTEASREHSARTRSSCVWKIVEDCLLHSEYFSAHVPEIQFRQVQ